MILLQAPVIDRILHGNSWVTLKITETFSPVCFDGILFDTPWVGSVFDGAECSFPKYIVVTTSSTSESRSNALVRLDVDFFCALLSADLAVVKLLILAKSNLDESEQTVYPNVPLA